MENEPLNSIQNLINKLSEKTFIDNINDLLRNEATNSFLKSFLIELKKNKKLNDLYLSKEYDYIKNYNIIIWLLTNFKKIKKFHYYHMD